MRNSLDEYGIGNYLDQKQRDIIINDIQTIYPGGKRWRSVLHNMRDSQLLAFRNDLVQRGKLNKTLPQLSIKVVMKECSADTYTHSTWGEHAHVFRLGQNVDRTTLKTTGEKSSPHVVQTTPNFMEEKSSPHVVQTNTNFPGLRDYEIVGSTTLQVGEIVTDSNYFITDCTIYGKKLKRFIGCKLFGF